MYDYILSFDREARYIWRRRLSSASVLYVLLRYASLAAVVSTMLNLFPFSGKTCVVRLVSYSSSLRGVNLFQ